MHSYVAVQQGANGTVAGVDRHLFLLLKCPRSLLGLSGDLRLQNLLQTLMAGCSPARGLYKDSIK